VWETHANNPLDNGDNANDDTESDVMDNEDLRPPQSEQRPSSKVPPAEQQVQQQQQQQQQMLDNMEAGPSGECRGHANSGMRGVMHVLGFNIPVAHVHFIHGW